MMKLIKKKNSSELVLTSQTRDPDHTLHQV
jgi:hypothetical protein